MRNGESTIVMRLTVGRSEILIILRGTNNCKVGGYIVASDHDNGTLRGRFIATGSRSKLDKGVTNGVLL